MPGSGDRTPRIVAFQSAGKSEDSCVYSERSAQGVLVCLMKCLHADYLSGRSTLSTISSVWRVAEQFQVVKQILTYSENASLR
jgi:hypothetical protein